MTPTEQLLDQAARHLDARRFAEADSSVATALLMEPRNLRALCFKAIIAAELGRPDIAIPTIERAMKLAPQAPAVVNNAACVFARVGQIPRAIELWRWLAAMVPGSVDAYFNMAVSYGRLNDPDKAEPLYRKVLAIAPNHPSAAMNLADILKNSGRIEDALDVIRAGLRLNPADAKLAGGLLYGLHFHPAATPADILRECAAWGAGFEAGIPAFTDHTNDRSPDRRLRVGYLSPNFRDHSETYFVLPLFRASDRSRYESCVYSCNAADDAITPLLREHADTWRDVPALTDEQLARAIKSDQIDILVDLTMHMNGSRLGVFARRAAPVQVTWLAYPSTTGLTRMDYAILDPHIDPTRAPCSTEKAWHLPHCYWCYEVYGPRPDVSSLPADSKGHITFGSLNHYGKVTRETLTAWGEILRRVENSRLLLHVGTKGAEGAAKAALAAMGIAPARITCQLRVSRDEYMRTYHGIDIALDPFPYNGATTTCDALWMGVPVISRAGATAVSRAGASIMANLGTPELVSETWDGYIAVAESLARDLPRLRTLRSTLRARLEQSKVMDAKAFAEAMTQAYRAMWQSWCASPA